MPSSVQHDRSGIGRAIVGITALAAIGVGGWLLVSRLGPPPRIRLVSPFTSSAAATAPAATSAANTSTPVEPAKPKALAPSHSRSATTTAQTATPATDTPTMKSEGVEAKSADNDRVDAVVPVAGVAPDAADSHRATEATHDDATYSVADRDVQPPTPVRPELVAALDASRPGIRLDILSIAVIVKPDGSVESVSGLNNPENLAEFLLLTNALSVVKSWSFLPATKAGTPVRYRQVVPMRDVVRAPE